MNTWCARGCQWPLSKQISLCYFLKGQLWRLCPCQWVLIVQQHVYWRFWGRLESLSFLTCNIRTQCLNLSVQKKSSNRVIFFLSNPSKDLWTVCSPCLQKSGFDPVCVHVLFHLFSLSFFIIFCPSPSNTVPCKSAASENLTQKEKLNMGGRQQTVSKAVQERSLLSSSGCVSENMFTHSSSRNPLNTRPEEL